MKLEMTTNWLELIQPGLYGTNLGYIFDEIDEEYASDFKTQLCFEAESIMNEIFSEDWFVDRFGNVTVSNVTFHSPQYYNYVNDRLDFDMEIENPDRIIIDYCDTFEVWNWNEFFKWAEKNYGSYDGFVSFFPYTREKFHKALHSRPNGNYDFNRAIAMLLMYAIENSNCALDSYQQDLENNMEEYCSNYGLCGMEFDDEELY